MAAAGGREEEALAPRLMAAAGERREHLLQMLERLARHDAPSGDAGALEASALLLERWLREIPGARVQSHPGPAGPAIEALWSGGGEAGGAEAGGAEAGGGEALILCHYDTVWPAGTARERPFAERDGFAHGPGVLDMRGGIVAAVGAMRLLAELDAFERPVRLLLTPDEETGSASSRELIQMRAREAAIVLVPEPALPGGAIKTQRKGRIVCRITVRGRAAHAGLEPERGVSAIDELIDLLIELRGLADPARGTTVNVGELSAGNPVNVVSALAQATLEIRFGDAAEQARVREAIAALSPGRAGAELDLRELHSRVPLERRPALAAAAAHAKELAASMGIDLREGAAGGVSDASLAAAECASVLDGLGPEGAGAHAADERVSIDSIVQRTALIALLAARLRPEPAT